jgi:hypothetical protein
MGESSIKITDFARKMKKTDFLTQEVEKFIKDITGESVDLERL